MLQKSVIKLNLTSLYHHFGDNRHYYEIIAMIEWFHSLGHRIIRNAYYWYKPVRNKYFVTESDYIVSNIEIYNHRYAKSRYYLSFRRDYLNFEQRSICILVERNNCISPIWANNVRGKIFDTFLFGNFFNFMVFPDNIRPSAISLTTRQIKYNRLANVVLDFSEGPSVLQLVSFCLGEAFCSIFSQLFLNANDWVFKLSVTLVKCKHYLGINWV